MAMSKSFFKKPTRRLWGPEFLLGKDANASYHFLYRFNDMAEFSDFVIRAACVGCFA
jgi:hypothetical protein